MSRTAPADLLLALGQRLVAAAEAMGVADVADPSRPAESLAGLLEQCRRSRSTAECWLVLCAVSGALPAEDDVRQLLRLVRTQSVHEAMTEVLREAIGSGSQRPDLELDVVAGGVVVDVDFCARHELNSGVQRVVRRTLPRWRERGRAFTPTAWTDDGEAPRTLGPSEDTRVFAHELTGEHGDVTASADTRRARLVVPWRGTMVLAEVPRQDAVPGLAALASLSGNRLACVGYDAIPVVDADTRPTYEITAFTHYLSVVKHAEVVAAISESAATEFAGFADALVCQGLTGPRVVPVPLPVEPVGSRRSSGPRRPGRVRLLSVGALEPHKNQRAVLHAAERLWQEGLDFELDLLGGRGWSMQGVEKYLDHLRSLGRPVRHLGRLDDADLDTRYREADAVVTVSLHEGYGLPAAEALASGTPVLTSNYGSLAEVSEGGGALLADPRDDDQVTDQMRRLVVDDSLREQLAGQARGRTSATWDDYAERLWETLVATG